MDGRPYSSATVNKPLNKALFDTAVGREGLEGHLRVSGGSSGDHLGTSLEVHSEVNSGSILRSFWSIQDPISGNLINILKLGSFGRR